MKIPKHAKKVFEGIIYDVYHWEQERFDGSTATYEGLKRPDSVNVIGVTEEKKILVGHQHQPPGKPFVGILGGMVDEGEDPLQAGKRELLEESGFVSDDWELWNISEPSTTKMEWTVYSYIARGCRKVREPEHEPGERIELDMIGFDEFLDFVSRPDFREKEVSFEILRMRLDEKKLEEFRKKLLK